MADYGATHAIPVPDNYAMDDFGELPSHYAVGGKLGKEPKSPLFLVIGFRLFAPCALFAVISSTMSFETRYRQPMMAFSISAFALGLVMFSGIVAFRKIKEKNASDPPYWYVFYFVSCFLAWGLAFSSGESNFVTNTHPFYDIINLNSYKNVDPSVAKGQRYMDGGRIEFAEGSTVDISRAVGFKDVDVYCVAPITKGVDPLSRYDFWAVGLNCCSLGYLDGGAEYHCGEYRNPKAKSGLRLMREDLRPFFRLAVQQAEASSNFTARHPLFYYWMEDPLIEVRAYENDGYLNYMLGVCGYFTVQLCLVVIGTLLAKKAGG